jgi:hypothetical protein
MYTRKELNIMVEMNTDITHPVSDKAIKEIVDSYKAVIAASHRLIEDPRRWELHYLAGRLIDVDNGTSKDYHTSTPEEKVRFFQRLGKFPKNERYKEFLNTIDKMSGGKFTSLTNMFIENGNCDMIAAIEAVQSSERNILSGVYTGGFNVYHGTAYHDIAFERFDEDNPIWFTSDLSYAKGYSESRTGMMDKRAFKNFEYFELDDFKYTRDDAKDMLRVNQDIRVAKLDLRKPAVIGDPHDYLYPDKLMLWLKDLSSRLKIPFEELDSIKLPDYVGDWHNQDRQIDTLDFIHNPDFVKILENHGYDGMITTEYGDYHVYCYAAFHNNQIQEITPNSPEWRYVDDTVKHLKATYIQSWVEEGHRDEIFDEVEKIFKKRSCLSPKERLRGGLLDKHFEKMGIKLIDNVKERARQAIHDRIIMPSARSFTSQQLDILKQYRALFPDVADARKLFTALHEEVCNLDDVTGKPEKWKSDTLKELENFSDGISREQSKGLHV